MGQTFSILTNATRGIDGASDPSSLGSGKLRHAVNLQFHEGRVMTRPPFHYQKFGLRGQFQGATLFNPSHGISFRPFAPCGTRMATAVGGRIFVNHAPEEGVDCNPAELKNPDLPNDCGVEADELCSGDINLFQAENYLIVQGLRRNTMWWEGDGDLSVSPGMVAELDQNPDQHSHDTFTSDHKNWLINGAGLGIYWNGRIHQQGKYGVFVGDILHKRGAFSTEDILLMEEQSKAVCGPPLSTNSSMGQLIAMEGIPRMDTPNGQGVLLGYYEGGIVSYNTFIFPRASAFDPKGQRLASGWDTKQMVNHNCNVVSATGRYAVGTLPRDHFFRSGFGIHVLSRVLGVEFINDEVVNIISDEVSHILNADDPTMLHGAAAGCWYHGHRWFVTTGLTEFSEKHSSSPAGKGFVSWNKTWKKSEDKTPAPAWEGVWIVDAGMYGIHKFSHTGVRADKGCFGFIASDSDRKIYYAAIQPEGSFDLRDGKRLPIGWAFETGRFNFGDTTRTKVLNDGRFEGLFRHKGTRVTVYVRTDNDPKWQKWRAFDTCERDLEGVSDRLFVSKTLGRPPSSLTEATWFEFRVEGTGAAEITAFEVEISTGSSKIEAANCRLVSGGETVNPLAVAI